MVGSGPNAKRPRVEEQCLDDSFDEPPQIASTQAKVVTQPPVRPLVNAQYQTRVPIRPVQPTQPNRTITQHQTGGTMFSTQKSSVSNPVRAPGTLTPRRTNPQQAAQLNQSGQLTMLQKQKENAERNAEKLLKEKALQASDMAKQLRQMEQEKEREIRRLREQLSSAQRDNMALSFRVNTTLNGDITMNNSMADPVSNMTSSQQAPPTSVLRTKPVEMPARGTAPSAASRFSWMNKANQNSSVFKHPPNNGNDTFAQMSSQGMAQSVFVPTASSQIPTRAASPKPFLTPRVESTVTGCQTDEPDTTRTVTLSPDVMLISHMLEAAISQPPVSLNYDAIESFSRPTDYVSARDVIRRKTPE